MLVHENPPQKRCTSICSSNRSTEQTKQSLVTPNSRDANSLVLYFAVSSLRLVGERATGEKIHDSRHITSEDDDAEKKYHEGRTDKNYQSVEDFAQLCRDLEKCHNELNKAKVLLPPGYGAGPSGASVANSGGSSSAANSGS